MNVLLDNIIFSLQKNGGISVYWAQLIRHLQNAECGVRMLERSDVLANQQRRCLPVSAEEVVADSLIPFQLARYLPVTKACNAVNIFHTSYYRLPLRSSAKSVVTVYDFTYELFSSGLRQLVHTTQKHRALAKADRIICISQNTARDLARLYPDVQTDKVRVVPLACSTSYGPLEVPLTLPFGELQDSRFVLFVGDRSRYKNFELAVRAMGMMRSLKLVAVGGKPLNNAEKMLVDKELKSNFIHIPFASESDLNILYNHAHCLLYPSAYEGFGLPPLEAMQAGCPVVALNCSSIPEVCGDAALLIDSGDADLLAARLQQLFDPGLRKEVRDNGYKQSASFSWVETCRKTVEIYAELARCV